MIVPRRPSPVRNAFFAMATLGLAAIGCIDRPVADVKPRTQSGVSEEIRNDAIDSVDLLMMVDNSNSMRENQENIVAQLRPLIETLTNPPDRNGDMRPDYPPVTSLHVGVVSSDLGTPGATVRGCDNSDQGDHGLLNPIRFGPAMQRHLPWTAAPAGFRPDDCNRTDQFPSFITFESGATDVTGFTHDFHCNSALYVNGCGLEQQLEAVWRALVFHRADDRPGNQSPNAGFMRENALLAILMLTDEEDGSVRDCRYAEDPANCQDALSVFNSTATGWSASNLNMRFYMYQPCAAEDPTWPLERYVDPNNLNRGFLSLKPGHPERIVFAAITGVPLTVPTVGMGTGARTDWDALLGPPGPGGANDFCGRQANMALDDMNNREGPISMRQANRDPNPNCTDRVVPSCRREGSTYDPANPPCSPTEQYFAWPARRVVEIARRFDQAPLCNGGPCQNGLVTSICRNNYQSAMQTIIEKIQSRLTGRCLPRVLQVTEDTVNQTRTVSCLVRESLPPDGQCNAELGRTPLLDDMRRPVIDPNTMGPICEVGQVPTSVSTQMPVTSAESPAGWYYDTTVDPSDPNCRQRITFTPGAGPPNGSRTRLECIQAVGGG